MSISKSGQAGDRSPITLALVNDHQVVVAGVARMFHGYSDRVAVVEPGIAMPSPTPADIALYDAFARPSTANEDFLGLARGTPASRVVVHTWNFHPRLVEGALANGAAGYLSKALAARELVGSLERIHAGELVVSAPPRPGRLTVGLDWPGRTEGLSERESEVLALIVQGRSNVDISEQLLLSLNTIKTYIRSAYRKIAVTKRVAAVLWGIEHGFRPDRRRIEAWIFGTGPRP